MGEKKGERIRKPEKENMEARENERDRHKKLRKKSGKAKLRRNTKKPKKKKCAKLWKENVLPRLGFGL